MQERVARCMGSLEGGSQEGQGARGREGRAAGDLAKGLSKAASEPAESGSPCAVPPLNFIIIKENAAIRSNSALGANQSAPILPL